MADITISDYTEKSFAVRGNTKEYSRFLADSGGKWNPNLKDGAGWIFSMKKKENIENWLNSESKDKSKNESKSNLDSKNESKLDSFLDSFLDSKLDKILEMLTEINKKLDLN